MAVNETNRIRLVLLIRSLDFGGAQRQLVNLTKTLSSEEFDVAVISFYEGGHFQDELRTAGITHVSLHKSGRWDLIRFGAALRRELQRLEPHILFSFLDVPNILALTAKGVSRKTRIVWGIRITELDLRDYDWLARASAFAERSLSRAADLIIVNSHAGHERMLRIGFPKDRTVVVPNGIDTEMFCPNEPAGARVRAMWGFSAEQKLIGLVGRLDPVKGHELFLETADLLVQQRDDVRFLCVGEGPSPYAEKLRELSATLSVGPKVHWIGAETNMPAVYNALDLLVSSSRAEGFPNVVAEAMACGVPVVATNVGDSALLVGDSGRIVESRVPEVMAEAINSLLGESRAVVGRAARQRIVEKFGLRSSTELTAALLRKLVRAG